MIPGITEKEEKIIIDILKEYRNEFSFYYYGSRAKGNFEKTSDLDILIKGKTKIPLRILQKLKDFFDLSDLPYVVNFSDYHYITSDFYEIIKPSLVPVF